MNWRAQIDALFGADAIRAAQAHARAEFPKESCGYIAGGVYVACENLADDPLTQFRLVDGAFADRLDAGEVQAVVHSHPNGNLFPSQADMLAQMETKVPFVIVTLNEDQFGDVVAWGDTLPIAPIISRPFVHGVFDCYSGCRDIFRLGREELAKQGVGWPFPPIELPQVARDDAWWSSGADLYLDHMATFGFREIAFSDVQPGDAFLIALGDGAQNPKKRLNHAGVLLENDLLFHHLPGRLSRRETAGIWFRAADKWLRYEGAGR